MIRRPFRLALVATAALALVPLAGCGQIRDHQGYLADDLLVASIRPGVDNRESVQGTLGRPTFTGQFGERDWYYVSRDTRQLAFSRPRPVAQQVIHVRFDETGNVASVEKTGLEQVASIDPMNDETPTLGRDGGFFEELFGNIGQVGLPGMGTQTADNPQ